MFVTLKMQDLNNGSNTRSSGPELNLHNSCKLGFPLVSILYQFLFIVEKFFVKESRILEVWTFNNRINWARFLAETAENTLCHVDIVLSSSAWSIWSWFRLNFDCICWTGGFAKFASDATFFTSWVTAKCMLTSEHGRERTLLPRIVKNVIRLKCWPQTEEEWWPGQFCHNHLVVERFSNVTRIDLGR